MFDILSGFKCFKTSKATSEVFCLEVFHNLLMAGGADGNMLVYDTNNGECLYG